MYRMGVMLKTIKQQMQATLDLKDGPTIPEIVEHLAASALTTLSNPTREVEYAICAKAAEFHIVLSYEQARAIFIAGITRAGKE